MPGTVELLHVASDLWMSPLCPIRAGGGWYWYAVFSLRNTESHFPSIISFSDTSRRHNVSFGAWWELKKSGGKRDSENRAPLQRPTCGEIFRLVDLPHMRKVWKNWPADSGAPDWKHVPAEWRISWPKSGPVGWEGRVLGRKGHQTRRVLQSPPDEYSVRLGHRWVLSKIAFLSRLFTKGLASTVPQARWCF